MESFHLFARLDSDSRSNMIPMAKHLQMLQEGSGGSDRRQWEPLERKGGSQEKEGMTRKSSKTNVPQRRRPSGN